MITRRHLFFTIIGLGSLGAIPAAAQTVARSWRTYRNPRFGTTIDYPAQFRPGRPPANGDGLGFTSADGASFSVFGGHNALEQDLAALETSVRESHASDRISYDQRGENWVVVSGLHRNAIFYERWLLSHGGRIVNGFVIGYPQRLGPAYDPIVTRMSQSFRAGSGDDIDGNPQG
jgi:hypothetical protein